MVGLELEERNLVEDFGKKCETALTNWDLVIKNYTMNGFEGYDPKKAIDINTEQVKTKKEHSIFKTLRS